MELVDKVSSTLSITIKVSNRRFSGRWVDWMAGRLDGWQVGIQITFNRWLVINDSDTKEELDAGFI